MRVLHSIFGGSGLVCRSYSGSWLVAAMVTAGMLTLPPAAQAAGEVTSYALVRDDATLEMRGKHLRLSGIYIPETNRVCAHRTLPVRCGSRAARALRFKLRGFVSCRLGTKYADGSIAAYCSNEDQDLGAYLIERGWALALPGAPFSYHVRERIARHHGFGVWGFPVDRIVSTP